MRTGQPSAPLRQRRQLPWCPTETRPFKRSSAVEQRITRVAHGFIATDEDFLIFPACLRRAAALRAAFAARPPAPEEELSARRTLRSHLRCEFDRIESETIASRFAAPWVSELRLFLQASARGVDVQRCHTAAMMAALALRVAAGDNEEGPAAQGP
jgi:hypothetical protein